MPARAYQGGEVSSGSAWSVQLGCRNGVPADGACGSVTGAVGAAGAGDRSTGTGLAFAGFSDPAASNALRTGAAAAGGPWMTTEPVA